MISEQQEAKYQEILAILNEMQSILAATISLNNPEVMAMPATVLVHETINQIIMLDGMTAEQQDAVFKQLQDEYEQIEGDDKSSKKSKGSTKVKTGKVLH